LEKERPGRRKCGRGGGRSTSSTPEKRRFLTEGKKYSAKKRLTTTKKGKNERESWKRDTYPSHTEKEKQTTNVQIKEGKKEMRIWGKKNTR